MSLKLSHAKSWIRVQKELGINRKEIEESLTKIVGPLSFGEKAVWLKQCDTFLKKVFDEETVPVTNDNDDYHNDEHDIENMTPERAYG